MALKMAIRPLFYKEFFEVLVFQGITREKQIVLLRVCKLGALQKARLRKVNFSGDFLGVFDFLRIACSLGNPQENL